MDNVLVATRSERCKRRRKPRALEIDKTDFHFPTAPATAAVLLFLLGKNNVLKDHSWPNLRGWV
jgi:hypothetical protein